MKKVCDFLSRKVIKLFSLYMEAAKVAQFVGVSWQSINKIYKALRPCIMELCEGQTLLRMKRLNCMRATSVKGECYALGGRGGKGKALDPINSLEGGIISMGELLGIV